MSLVPMDVRAGNEKRKQLLQQLMQRMTQNSGGMQSAPLPVNAARPMLRSVSGSMSPALAGPKRPITALTQMQNIPPGLAALLGVGGIGNPGFGEFSHTPGAPVATPGRGSQIRPARAAGTPIPGGSPIPAASPAAPNVGANGHIQLSPGQSFDYSNPTPQDRPTNDPAFPVHTFEGSLPQPVPSPVATTPSGLVPLGNGIFYDPVKDVVRGTAGGAATGSAARRAF